MAFSGPSWPTEMCFIFSYQRFSHVDLRMDASVSANCCANGNFVNVINLRCRHVLRTYFAVCSVCWWIIRSSLIFLTGEFPDGETTRQWMQTHWCFGFGAKCEVYTLHTKATSFHSTCCLSFKLCKGAKCRLQAALQWITQLLSGVKT